MTGTLCLVMGIYRFNQEKYSIGLAVSRLQLKTNTMNTDKHQSHIR